MKLLFRALLLTWLATWGPLAQAQIEIRFGHVGEPGSLYDIAAQEYAKRINTKLAGKVKVTLGPETETFHRPRHKDVDVQMVVDLRRMLTNAGYNPDGAPAVEDEESRDHGDGRWGAP